MRTAVLFLILQSLCSAITHADQNLTKLVLDQIRLNSNQTFPILSLAAATPIRQVRLNFRIEKGTPIYRDDGSFYYDVHAICVGSTMANVYDTRKGDAPIGSKDFELFNCHSNVEGKPIEIVLGGALAMFSGPLFANKATDYKVLTAFLWSKKPDNGGWQPQTLIQSSGSTDLNTRSMMAFLNPSDLYDCSNGKGKCRPNVPASFSVKVEVVD